MGGVSVCMEMSTREAESSGNVFIRRRLHVQKKNPRIFPPVCFLLASSWSMMPAEVVNTMYLHREEHLSTQHLNTTHTPYQTTAPTHTISDHSTNTYSISGHYIYRHMYPGAHSIYQTWRQRPFKRSVLALLRFRLIHTKNPGKASMHDPQITKASVPEFKCVKIRKAGAVFYILSAYRE